MPVGKLRIQTNSKAQPDDLAFDHASDYNIIKSRKKEGDNQVEFTPALGNQEKVEDQPYRPISRRGSVGKSKYAGWRGRI
jgi:hypothetical protein